MLSRESDEIVRCGVMTCETWEEFLGYYRFMKPELKGRVQLKRAAVLWKEVKKRRACV
jgi:hypothetical protein